MIRFQEVKEIITIFYSSIKRSHYYYYQIPDISLWEMLNHPQVSSTKPVSIEESKDEDGWIYTMWTGCMEIGSVRYNGGTDSETIENSVSGRSETRKWRNCIRSKQLGIYSVTRARVHHRIVSHTKDHVQKCKDMVELMIFNQKNR